jgi:preprotein translocase subunit SecG
MEVVKIILTVLEVIASLALVLVVLMQSGKEAGLSGAIAGNSESYMSKNGSSLDKTLASTTKWVALAWILLTLSLSLI